MVNKHITLIGMATAALIILAGCSSAVHIEKDRHTDFRQYKTFAWIGGNKDKSRNGKDLEEQQVHEAVSKELASEGWVEVRNNPDLLVSYDVLVERGSKNQSDPVYSYPYTRSFFNPYTRRWGTIYYPSQFYGYNNYNVPVREGTLTITMMDANTEKTVWQGWTTGEVNSRNLTGHEIKSNVRSIFRKFDIAKK